MKTTERAERLIWLAQQNPDACLADLAFACERSAGWTKKTLAAAGIVPPGAEKSLSKSKDRTLCLCGHRRDEHCRGIKFCDHMNPWRYENQYERQPDGTYKSTVWLKKVPIPIRKAELYPGGTHCTICDHCHKFHGPEKSNLRTSCANPECGDAKADHCWTIPWRKGGTGPHNSHYTPEGNWYTCLSNHCVVSHYRDGKHEPCSCMDFVDPFAKPGKRKKKAIPATDLFEFETQEEPQPDQEGERGSEMKLDAKGRCCGRKPLVYRRRHEKFCCRCDRSYDLVTGEQIENWAYKWVDGQWVDGHYSNH